ncbi:hypothetical protein, partial [Neisseria dentiae]|uniref:hypothetical protein n=1 Tax=Neisseria dentiae TaxID=194197 RepID=UPI0035A13044
ALQNRFRLVTHPRSTQNFRDTQKMFVILGLDPSICPFLRSKKDTRVKPEYDEPCFIKSTRYQNPTVSAQKH